MKSPAEDHDLRALLSTWRPPPPARDPHFQSAVWTRINAHPAPTPVLLTLPGKLLSVFMTRALAATTATVATAAIVGVTLALSYNHAQATDRMAAAYIARIDPLQRAHLPGPAAATTEPATPATPGHEHHQSTASP
ncbi:hypothetical protein [Geminisphaera colitermitum]|uniref:hypothetical protein n=1 Tax=Geminisphaera colitermitum TaxID=1148786 RepID=UPI0001964F84|nr:hypothetical protein [Geminisphaera colitermitum]